jgi:hypothetical protein
VTRIEEVDRRLGFANLGRGGSRNVARDVEVLLVAEWAADLFVSFVTS